MPSSEDSQNDHLHHLLGDDASDTESLREDGPGRRTRRCSKSSVFTRLGAYFLSGLLISSIGVLLVPDDGHKGTVVKTSFTRWEPSSACGNTPAEALARGCVYDEVLLHWIPRECSSPELIDEFVHVWPWRFWTSKAATQELSLAEVRQGDQVEDKWVSFGLHRWHCVATWKSLTYAAMTGTKVPAFVLDWNHTVHCSDHVLINMHPGSPFDINSHLDIEYTPCVSLEMDRTLQR
ncbi:hypothetical protein PpBr36_04829 [Pyricularia pennisetigena]|uniref:hypothetical protein n=1 Tax=Pyricularia pennisetigena TaxID=1578925 RepID=UPI00115053A4|nr:hypothetical protein PpBr36_04829 [Pyricularia pennisetigena]TLS26758.1 hypothetical protein PpBr36_04829 [Pyricularia pennisetigena]